MNDSFHAALSAFLAHSAVFFSRVEWEPVADCRCEDPDAPDPGKTAERQMDALAENYPRLINNIKRGIVPLARADLRARTITAPGELSLLQQFGPATAAVSNQIDAANKMSGAQADLSVLQGPGGQAADEALAISKRMDPEFYGVREQTASSIYDLLGTGLTPGEEEAISRSLARDNAASGLLGLPTSTGTVANAMTFGGAARNRQLQGIGAATSFLPQSRSNFDPVQIALGRPSIASAGSKFGDTGGASNEAGQLAQGLLGEIGGFSTQYNELQANKRNYNDLVDQAVGSVNV